MENNSFIQIAPNSGGGSTNRIIILGLQYTGLRLPIERRQPLCVLLKLFWSSEFM